MIYFSAAYLISYILAKQGMYLPSGVLLICAAVFLYLKEYQRTGMLLNFRGLLALGLIGGEGISCFKLSQLQTDWSGRTWISYYLFYLVFFFVYSWLELWLGERCGRRGLETSAGETLGFYRRAILGLLLISYGAFFFEAWQLGYVPLLVRDTPHAYSYFHITGVHYFTTLVVLIPALGVIYQKQLAGQQTAAFQERRCTWLDPVFLLSILLPLLLTVLLVSRFQFMFAVLLAVFAGLLLGKKYRLWQLLLLGVGMVCVYVLITIARAHSVSYLNGIFEMKNPDIPIFITQPYIYIANNYDNFNCMTEQLAEHSYGLKMLFPLFALTGLKFVVPEVLSFPLYTTKEELTTLTLIYDAYYDFGLVGVLLFALVLALVCAWLTDCQRRTGHVFVSLIYVQFAFYLLFSFFTTWFSNPSTWFYLAVTVILFALFEFWRRRHHS